MCHAKGKLLLSLVELVELIHALNTMLSQTGNQPIAICQYWNSGKMGPINQAESTKWPQLKKSVIIT